MAVKKNIAIAGFWFIGSLLSLFSIVVSAQSPKLNLRDGVVCVTGLEPEVLYTFHRYFNSQKDWETVFPVTLKENVGGIVINGTYEILHDEVRFTPRFAFSPSVVYNAKFFSNELAGNRNEVYLPAMDETIIELDFSVSTTDKSAPALLEIYPTTNLLPENLLKFHIRFSKSMTVGEAYSRIKLLDSEGKNVEKPFLIIDQELWDKDMKMLTIMLDPGRIKRGLRPNVEMKTALQESQTYSLVVEGGWKDIDGKFTQQAFVKTFQCSPADRTSPVAAAFSVVSPTSANAPLVIYLQENMNYVLLGEAVRIQDPSGRVVEGMLNLRDNETVIEFVPKNPWSKPNYTIQFNPLLEDLAGNNFNRLFDEDLASTSRPQRPSTTLFFQVTNTVSQ